MKRVPAEEFAEHAAEYLTGTEPVAIEKDGKVIGQYMPAPNGHAAKGTSPQSERSDAARLRDLEKGIDPEFLAFAKRLDRLFQNVYERTGMTEDELVELLDAKRRQSRNADNDP